MNNVSDLARCLNIQIKNPHYYQLALTHPSNNADANTKHQDYERLEYMGDAVLDYVSADIIFKEHPKMDQGLMSKLRSHLVKSHSLAEYARKIDLAKYIKTGHSLNAVSINASDKILEDVFEALIGAIYLDLGMEAAYQHISNFILEDVKTLGADDLTDCKTKLQEEMQSEFRDSVHYVLTSQTGPAHDRTFNVNVMFNDIVLASGSGKSKKAAEEEAARNALKKRIK
ncbi:MAG: ribonuclease III [Bacilli bacterium]|nr:ribonuclease III [Bacilli bacterium]